MPFSPINLGDLMLQGEQIKSLRHRRQPQPTNPLDDLLKQARIDSLNAKANNPQGVANYAKQPFFVRQGNKIKAYQLSDQGGAREIELPEGAMPAIQGRWTDLGGGMQFLDRYGRDPSALLGAAGVSVPEPDDLSGINLGGGNRSYIEKTLPPAQQPDNIKEGEKAKAEGKTEAERESVEAQNKQAIREIEANHAQDIISGLLAPRPDGDGIMASYAYGRANSLVPDTMKPQEWIDAEAQRNQLISMLQLENVAKLKGTGPITEPEQKILRQAMTVLENTLISDKLVEKELKRVDNLFKKWARDAVKAQGKSMSDAEYEARKKRLLGG